MKKASTLLAVVLLLNATVRTQGQPTDVEKFLDSLGTSLISSGKITGVVLAVGTNDSSSTIKAFGSADIEFDVAMRPDASFEIGSVTKQFTTVGIMQLAERKLLRLEDDFTKYIPFNTSGRKITIRQLMTNTSGIPDYPSMPWMAKLRQETHARDTLLRRIEKEEMDFEPGHETRYSSTNFFILGLIIEKLSKLSYEDYVEKNLFVPAGMTSSFYCSDNKVRKNRAHGYELIDNEFVRSGFFLRKWPYAAGALCSTAEDLLKWNRALHGTAKILSPASYAQLISCGVLVDGTVTRYASGIASVRKNNMHTLMHSGGIDGFLTENRYFPEARLSIVVLMNSTGGGSPIRVADAITNFIFRPGVTAARKHTPDKSFQGIYQSQWRDGTRAEVNIENSEMWISVGDREKRKLNNGSGTTYTDPNGLFEYTFTKTKGGIQLRIDEAYFNYVLKKI